MSSQSNKSSRGQFLPECIWASSKAAHLTSTFSVVISRISQGWMRTDRWAIEAQTGITYIAVALLVTFHKLLFQPQAFSLSLYEEFLSSFIDEVCAKVGLWTVMYQSNRNFNISPPPLASIPRACDTLTVPGGENLIIRVLQGVGNLNCTLNFMWNLWHGELSSGPWC